MTPVVKAAIDDYAIAVAGSLRVIVWRAMLLAQTGGVTTSRPLWVSFRTGDPGVMISDRLRKRHPEDLVIVFQDKYLLTEVDEESFSVVMDFAGVREALTVPYAAVSGFADGPLVGITMAGSGLSSSGQKASAPAKAEPKPIESMMAPDPEAEPYVPRKVLSFTPRSAAKEG